MTTTEVCSGNGRETTGVGRADMKLEGVIIAVADVDRAREFYGRLGWRLDATPSGVVQLTPSGSWCSVQFGANVASAAPGSGKGYLVVSDLQATLDKLAGAGVDVDEGYLAGLHGVPATPTRAKSAG